MSTLCKEVQEVVSAAFDGAITDREAVVAAKTHCATCAECAAFVRFLGSIRGIDPPAPSEETLTRILETVRAQADAERAAEAQRIAAETQEDAVAAVSDAESAPAADVDGVAPEAAGPTSKRPDWRSATPWIAAAAALLVGAVLVTAEGVRYIMGPAAEPSYEVSVREASPEDTARPMSPMAEDDAVARGDADGDTGTWTLESGGPVSTPFVAYGGFAYRVAGAAAAAPEGPPAGTLSSGLDTGMLPVPRDVWTDDTSAGIVVDAGDGRYLRFGRVERSLDGRAFALSAERIESFETPVGLPSSIPAPTQPDGWPTFLPAGTDDSGSQVYVRPGTEPTAGFALAPGVESTEWTWWLPVQ